MFKSLDGARAKPKKQAQPQQPKFRPSGTAQPNKGVLDSRQAQKLINKTQGKSREGDLQFDKIPHHRQSKSPRSKTIEVNEEAEDILELDIDEDDFKEDGGNESQCEEEDKKGEKQPLTRQTVFQSYESTQPKPAKSQPPRKQFDKPST